MLQNLALLGIGTTADATNPFSAKLNKALWTAKTAAEGGDGDLRYTMNKETAADVLSLLLQRGFSGRAEIGLIGDDDLTFKVSPDGSTWVDGARHRQGRREYRRQDRREQRSFCQHLRHRRRVDHQGADHRHDHDHVVRDDGAQTSADPLRRRVDADA